VPALGLHQAIDAWRDDDVDVGGWRRGRNQAPIEMIGCRGALSEAPSRKRDRVVVESQPREHSKLRGTQFPGPVWTSLAGVAHLLGVKRRKVGELRRDPAFPSGRLFGGGGTLRFKVAEVLAWADHQPEAKFSTLGSPARFIKRGEQAQSQGE